MNWRTARTIGRLVLTLCVTLAILCVGCPDAVAHGDTGLGGQWVTLNGSWVRGSVALGNVDGDGVDDVVVGGTDGRIYAYSGALGRLLWTYDTFWDTGKRAAIEGKAAIGDIDLDGHAEILIGVGSTFTPQAPGGMWALRHDGTHLWHRLSGDFNSDGVADGVQVTPALADVDLSDGGQLEVIYGAFDAHVRVLNHDGSTAWSYFTRDTIWSSPAVGDLDRDGRPEIVIGSDAHLEPAFGTLDGGKVYVFNGEDGSMVPGFFIQVDETVWSSPALGDLNGDGWLDIVVGTGDCYEHAACAPGGRTHPVTDALYAWDSSGRPLPGWPVQLSEFALASPTLGDLDGDGDLEIVINTGDGHVHVLEGDGSPLSGWPRLVTTPADPYGNVVHYATRASPVLADLTGDGRLEVILPSNWEIVVWDHAGQQLTRTSCCPVPTGQWSFDTPYTVYGTPAVGDVDGDGHIELIAAGGLLDGTVGALFRWDRDVSSTGVKEVWSCFRYGSGNSGRHPVPPRLESLQPAPVALHRYGDLGTARWGWRMANRGDGEVEWHVSQHPVGVTVTPSSGVVGWSGTSVAFDISASGLATGTYPLGDVVIAGTAPTNPAAVTVLTVPLTLRVGAVEHIYMPVSLLAGPW